MRGARVWKAATSDSTPMNDCCKVAASKRDVGGKGGEVRGAGGAFVFFLRLRVGDCTGGGETSMAVATAVSRCEGILAAPRVACLGADKAASIAAMPGGETIVPPTVAARALRRGMVLAL